MEGKKDGRIQGAIERRLSKVIDPETGLDVMRMGLIRDLNVTRGEVSLVFRPSSPLSTFAIPLGAKIHAAVFSVEGVQRVLIRVENFFQAEELEELLNGKKPARPSH